MIFKRNVRAALFFVGYTTVSFTMEPNMEDQLRRLGVSEENIQKTLVAINKGKNSDEIAEGFHVSETKSFNTDEEINEFIDVRLEEDLDGLTLENFPQNKPKGIVNAAAYTVGTYYNWLTGAKK